MSIDKEFLLNSFVILMGLFFTIYLIYGRVKRKPLIGSYKPGTPGYDEFLRIVDSKWCLVAAVAATLFSAVDLITVALTIINGPYSTAMLIVAPVFAITTSFIALWVAPYLLGKKSTNSKK